MTLYYKMRQILLQNASVILLQNATEVYYKMRLVFYYKMRQFYYKMGQLLQIATILLKKCDSNYKMRRLLQIETVQTFILTCYRLALIFCRYFCIMFTIRSVILKSILH